MKVLKLISILGLILLVAGVVGFFLIKSPDKNRSAQTTTGTGQYSGLNAGSNVGEVAPNFQLTKIDGSRVSVSELRGHPAVLIFWTAWCPVCKEEAPHFNELAARYGPKGVRVLGINIQDSEARTRAGIKSFGIQYAVARDTDAAVAKLYKVTGTPTVVLLDRNGVVRYTGNELPVDYAQRFDTMLAENG
ncbi:MAG TPA: TlpA disulfide reductase family protein [Pyrinomonadaceae bacterium]|nr:TlpA disulfide reductase family protein [Pyrinomonadaceae bacterium]